MLHGISAYIKYVIAGLIFSAMMAGVAWIINLFKKKKKQQAAAPQAGGQVGQMVSGAGSEDLALLVKEADNKLAQAKLGNMANLPVFLLMGDSGATKSTVMVQSGIDPDLLAGQVYQGTDVVPTRTANVWFARNALFVEAAGSLPHDPGAWGQMVKKLAPKTTVVGKGEQAPRAAVVFYDCEAFMQPGAIDAAQQSARLLRARLGEISQSLGINLPVYVVFSKVDRMPFFTDYVRNLSNEEAMQVFGVTLPINKDQVAGTYAEQETARLSWNFELLFKALADGRTEFLPRETDGSKLPGAYEFPREFRKVRPVLVSFLVDLCRPAQLTVGPFLRGFYFSGVRPVIINEGAPVNPFQAQPNQAASEAPAGATGMFRIGARPAAQPQQAPVVSPVTGSRKVPQWMFVTRLFTEILLADKAAMGAAGASTKTSSGRRFLFIAAAALCLFLTIFFTVSFFNNHGLESDLRAAAEGISAAPLPPADLAPVDELKKLDNLRQITEKLAGYNKSGAPITYHAGLYEGDLLYPEARRLYCARFNQLLMGQTQNAIMQSEKQLPPKQAAGSPDYGPTYDGLKAYLITTSNYQYADSAWLPPVLMTWWKNGRTASAEQTRLAQLQFDFYSAQRKEEDFCPAKNDAPSVKKAREYLLSFTGSDHVYAVLLGEANKANPPINYNKQFGAEYVKIVSDPQEVRGAFSMGGWKFMKDKIPQAEKYFTGDEWVLGVKSQATSDPESLRREIQSRYYSDFLREWRAYLRAGLVQRYTGIPDAASKLRMTSGPQSPLLAMMCLASENTAVDEPTVSSVFQPVQKVVPAPCSAQYGKPDNQSYMNALLSLQSSLEALGAQAPSPEAAAPTLQNASQAKLATRQLSNTFRSDSDTGPVVEKLLLDPITNAEGVIKGIPPAELNGKGKETCAKMAPLMSKFPFNLKSTQDASVQDINLVFAPNDGLIWQLWDGSLKKYVSRQGDPVPGAAVELTPKFRDFLRRAMAFTDFAYAGGATNPKFSYQLRGVVDQELYEKVTLNIDGQTAEFGPGSAAKKFDWPGGSQGLHLVLKPKGSPDSVTYPDFTGMWGIFHYTNENPRVGNVYEMEYAIGSGRFMPHPITKEPVKAKLEVTAAVPVFEKGYFTGLSCVAEVAK